MAAFLTSSLAHNAGLLDRLGVCGGRSSGPAASAGGGCFFRVDLHNHTVFSSDGALEPLKLLSIARDRGIHCLGVVDHNTLRGGLECVRLAALYSELPRVLPGVEIATGQGDLVGFFLEQEIPRDLGMEETAAAIRAQNGIVYLPHPFDTVRRSSVHDEVRERAAVLSDIVEVANGRALVPDHERMALALAARAGRRLGAGSDAHYAGEVGRVYVVTRELPGPHNLCEVLRAARPGGRSGVGQVGAAWCFCMRTGVSKVLAASWEAAKVRLHV